MKKLDEYLKTADKKQKLMLVALFIMIVGFSFNEFVVPMVEQNGALEEHIEEMKLKVSEKEITKLKKQLASKNKKLMKQRDDLEIKKDEMDYVISNIHKIKYAFFDDIQWANSLDDILKFSVKKSIKILSLRSSDAKEDLQNILKLQKHIVIDGSGRYVDIVALIQYIEQFETLVDFNSIDISLAGGSVKFSFDLSVYGVGL